MAKPDAPWIPPERAKLECPKIGKLGQRCISQRFHKGSHKFPLHPDKKPGQAVKVP